jgi:hypothetical protein
MQPPISPTDRTAFRAALTALATKTQAKIPALNGRVEKACRLVLAGDVALQGEGRALVHSLSDPGKTYTLEPGHCTCADFPRAPESLCAHRLAAGFARKLAELVPPDRPVEPAAVPALPEAPASCNVRVLFAGHEVQVTLRDSDEQRLLARLTALLKQPSIRPIPKPAPRQQGQWRKGGRP